MKIIVIWLEFYHSIASFCDINAYTIFNGNSHQIGCHEISSLSYYYKSTLPSLQEQNIKTFPKLLCPQKDNCINKLNFPRWSLQEDMTYTLLPWWCTYKDIGNQLFAKDIGIKKFRKTKWDSWYNNLSYEWLCCLPF